MIRVMLKYLFWFVVIVEVLEGKRRSNVRPANVKSESIMRDRLHWCTG